MSDTPKTIENIEFSQCVKSATHFGKTVYHNICTGATHDVPWGSVDWVNWVIGGGVLAVVVGLMVAMLLDW